MKDQELERRLEQALSHSAPDDLDGVLSRCQTRKGTVIPMTTTKRTNRWRPLIAACLALVLLGGGAAGYYYKTVNTVASIVSLDVNPSIQLKVNQKEKVLSATPMNEDAQVILEGMELEGTQVTVAMNAIIGALLQNGYVDELANSILITVEDEDVQRGEKLQQALTAQADAALANAQVNGAILAQTLQHSDQLTQKAQEYGISQGKAALIQTIVEGSGGLKTFEELVGLSINELNLIYSSQSTSGLQSQEGVIGGADGPTDIAVTNNIQTSGTASQSAYIGMDAAKSAALSHAGLSASSATFLEVDYDWEQGRMVYELEFISGQTKYEYEIDAQTGEVIKFETEIRGSGAVSGAGASSSSYIGEAAAKTAALNHAGVKESETTYCNAWLEYDDGRAEHYEVEFAVGNTRYEYEIALTSATVLKQEQKAYTSGAGSTGNTGNAGSTGNTGSAGGTGGTSSDIGLEGAKSAALSHAGVSASDASFTKTERDWDDGRLEYEIEFWVGGTEYDYKIAASDGTVLEYDVDRHGTDVGGSGSSSDIGQEAAKSAALNHAGVSSSETRFIKVERDWDDGRLEYEVEFETAGREYEYTIDGATGDILSYERD